MIVYSHEDPLCHRLLACGGSVVPAAARWAVLSGTTACVVSLAFTYAGVQEMVVDQLGGLGMIWAGFTAVLGMMVAFRNNQAYARFWEGASLVSQMRGEWLNATSSLLAFCSVDDDVSQDVQNFQQLLVRLISLLHCSALQNICEIDEDNLEILDVGGIEEASLLHLEDAHDRCEVIVHWLQRLIIKAQRENVLVADPPILSRCFQEISRGFVNLHNVRKIRDIPQPFPYTQVLLWAVLLHTCITPLFAGILIPLPYIAGLLCFLVTCMLWSIIYIADQIDQPFGEDPNDLPSVEMQSDFNDSLLGLMHPAVLCVPHFAPAPHGISLMSFSERHSASGSQDPSSLVSPDEEDSESKLGHPNSSRHSAHSFASAMHASSQGRPSVAPQADPHSRRSGVFVLPSSVHAAGKGNRFARQATKSLRLAGLRPLIEPNSQISDMSQLSRDVSDEKPCSIRSGHSIPSRGPGCEAHPGHIEASPDVKESTDQLADESSEDNNGVSMDKQHTGSEPSIDEPSSHSGLLGQDHDLIRAMV